MMKLSSQFDKDLKISKKGKSDDSEETIPHEDIDKNDFNDPQSVAEFVNQIYEYLMIK
jgi:hypothetical protein